jgi:hypothetical protein
MRKFAFIMGAVSISLTSLAILFKMLHWPFANYGLVLGISLFSLFFIPSIFKYFYDKENARVRVN